MKKIIFLSIIVSFFTLQLWGQQGNTLMKMLNGKWFWYSSEDGWGHHLSPEIVGHTRSVIFYQNKPNLGTDSLCYLTCRNNSIIASGRTYLVNIYQNRIGEIYSNIILEDTSAYNRCGYFEFSFSRDSILSFSLCFTDYFVHHYKKDSLYTHVDNALKNDIYTIYPNPNFGQFIINSSNTLNTIEIYDFAGKLVYSDNTLKRKTLVEIDLSHLQKGIYFARIQDRKQIVTEKIIIK